MADVKKFIKGVIDLPSHLKEAVESAHAPKVFYSTAGRLADKIAEANPKMSEYEVMKRALNQSTQKLDWERVDKPALEKVYGELSGSTFTDSKPKRLRNTPEVVEERKRKANEFLDQPTEPWVPPKPELQAFDRSSIKDALEGFPDVPQSSFPRDQPTRASTKHVEDLYNDPENRELIKKQIMRGLPLGGESFYASLYPVKQAVLEAGMPASKFDSWIHSLAPASARNSIMNEMAVGQFLRNMHSQGLSLDEATVAKQMAEFKKQFGMGLPLMPVHRTGVQNVLENNVDLRAHNLANIPTNYKIPTYGTQKAGDFAHSAVLDVHEAAGQSQGSRYHPYFTEAGGFGNTEYNAGEQGLLGIAKELGVPGGMAQAGRWFGGGELTGLRSPRGDALDLLEKQFAYTLQQQGRQPNPANIRSEVLKQIETGEGTLLPWYKKEGMPDVRTTGLQRKDGGAVNAPAASMDGDQFFQAAIKAGMSTDIGSLNKIVDLVNKGMSISEAIEALTNPMRKRDGGQVEHMQAGGVKKAIGALGELTTASRTPTIYEIAHQVAQRNAAKPVDLGGLGLHADNTAMDRAKALGFDLETYHGTDNPTIESLDPKRTKIIEGVFSSTNPMTANTYALGSGERKKAGDLSAPNVIPLLLNSKAHQKSLSSLNKNLLDSYRIEGYGGVYRPESELAVTFDPRHIRSRFAAFDPAEQQSTELLKAEGGKVEHMQAGGLKTLMGEVLNRGGSYAARRLERAADEIPNLEKLYEQQALKRAFISGDNAYALMTMKPSDFERYAAPLDSVLSERSLQKIADITNFHNNGGFSDVPYLHINKKEHGTTGLPWITGHEGRHRNRVMDAAGEQAGLVQLLPRAELREPFPRRSQQEYIEALKKEMDLTDNRVKPEKYYLNDSDDTPFQRRAIDLPDLYAEGGAVHLQIGGMTPEPVGGSARQETFAAQHMEEGGDIMRRLFDHALDKGDIHEMTHAMLVKQHEAEYG